MNTSSNLLLVNGKVSSKILIKLSMRIYKLDGLRGIFSLMIVFFHYRENYLPDFMCQIFFVREAYTFVDFFFVLSGYVIAFNYNNISNFDFFKTYIKKRFIRLFPLLFYTVTLMLLFDLIGNFYFPNLVNNVDTISILLIRYMDTLLFMNSTPILGSTSGINGVSWSISSEMISYFVFGLVSIYSIGKKKNILILSIIISCIAFSIFNGSHINTGDYGFVRGLISFNLGYFVWLFSKKEIKINNKIEILIPLFLLILFYIMNNFLSGFNKEMFVLFVIPLFFSVSILILIKTNGLISKILDSKSLIFLGDISYSLYLNHFLFLLIIPKIVFNLFNVPQTTFTEISVLVIFVIFIIYYSKLTYILIEKKGGSLLKNLINKK